MRKVLLFISTLLIISGCLNNSNNKLGKTNSHEKGETLNEILEKKKGFKKLQIGKNIQDFSNYIISSNPNFERNKSKQLAWYKIDHIKLNYMKFGNAKINSISLTCIDNIISLIEIRCDYDENLPNDLILFYGLYNDYKSEDKNEHITHTHTWISENYILTCTRSYMSFEWVSRRFKENPNFKPYKGLSVEIKKKNFDEEKMKILKNEKKTLEEKRKAEALKNF